MNIDIKQLIIVMEIILILYLIYGIKFLPGNLIVLFQNDIIKVLSLVGVTMLAKYDVGLSLLFSISLIMTFCYKPNDSNKNNMIINDLKVSDDKNINIYNKLNNEQKTNTTTPNIRDIEEIENNTDNYVAFNVDKLNNETLFEEQDEFLGLPEEELLQDEMSFLTN